jgi:hypothetical protein
LPAASLSKFTKPNAAMPTHADSTHPTIQPLRYTTPPGLFVAYICEAQRSHTFANTARLITSDRHSSFDLSVHFTNKSLQL